jgi:hypothetical protein
MTDHCNESKDDERTCPPQFTEKEAALVYENNRKYDPNYTFDGLNKLREWMEDTLNSYHLLVHAANGEIALRWNEIDNDIDILVTDEGREKVADRLLQTPELTEEQKQEAAAHAQQELDSILKNIDFSNPKID